MLYFSHRCRVDSICCLGIFSIGGHFVFGLLLQFLRLRNFIFERNDVWMHVGISRLQILKAEAQIQQLFIKGLVLM